MDTVHDHIFVGGRRRDSRMDSRSVTDWMTGRQSKRTNERAGGRAGGRSADKRRSKIIVCQLRTDNRIEDESFFQPCGFREVE